MLAQRQRRWADVVHMLYKCFVFAGLTSKYFPLNRKCQSLKSGRLEICDLLHFNILRNMVLFIRFEPWHKMSYLDWQSKYLSNARVGSM